MKEIRNLKHLNIEVPFSRELMLLETLNPCQQAYVYEDEALFVQYRQRMDVFNFLKDLTLKLPFTIIGMPFSVSHKGYFGKGDSITALIKKNKGLKVILNGDDSLDLPRALTLSSFVFDNHYRSFDGYLESLRSHYRYRLRKALKRGSALCYQKIESKNFKKDHYDLYLDVFNHSKDQLECLSIEFFKSFPSDLYEILLGNQVVGFYQLIEKEGCLYFLFGGFDRRYLKSHDLYLNLLLAILKRGIDLGVEKIEFGQTAEDSKMKIGCREVKKYLYVYHHNKYILRLIEAVLPLLSYRPKEEIYHVFKE